MGTALSNITEMAMLHQPRSSCTVLLSDIGTRNLDKTTTVSAVRVTPWIGSAEN